MPPAANRLVAKVARAVCAAIVPIVARKTVVSAGSSRSASNGCAVGADRQRSFGIRLPLGQRLVQVGELGEAGQRTSPRGDLAVALGDDLVDPRTQGAVLERVHDTAGGLDPAELGPRRRRRGRR